MSNENIEDHAASENTPLLSESRTNGHGDAAAPQTSRKSKGFWRTRGPSTVSLVLLCVLMVLIMLLGFFIPDAIQKYAIQASYVQLDSVVPELTDSGARARIRGSFSMRSSNVKSGSIKNLGVLGTWLAKEVETTRESRVEVTLPEYGEAALGIAVVPPLKVRVVDGETTHFDFVTELIPPPTIDPLQELFDDWVQGRLDHVKVAGNVHVALRSGIIRLPSNQIFQTLDISGDELPSLPQLNITRLNFHDPDLPRTSKGMVADATIKIQNDFPLNLALPSLNFDVRVDNCLPDEPKILLANATVQSLHIHPKEDIIVNATGYVNQPSSSLTDLCPGSGKSPLDTLLGGYIRGHQVMLYISGAKEQSSDVPKWMADIVSGVKLPVPFTGHAFSNVIKNFTLADLKFDLPDPFAEPGTPESNPQVSGIITAVIILPEEMNFQIEVDRVRATADIFYKKGKLGELNLRKWQPATSKRLENTEGEQQLLLVESVIDKAPLNITDEDAFTDVVQQLLFGQKPVNLGVKANVDVELNTALGILTVQEIPAEGKVPVKTILNGGLDSFAPTVRSLEVINSTSDGITLEATVDIDNPTEYAAVVPYIDVNILANNTLLGHVRARNLELRQGLNQNLTAIAVWEPKSGERGKAIGRELLSQWISGWNTSITIQAHEGTIPSCPQLGRALSKVNITVPIPHVHFPKDPDSGDDDDDNGGDDGDNGNKSKAPKFIKTATMHLFSSTAEFELQSPLTETTIYITYINATAFYKEDDVGSILYDLPFAVPPGVSTSPRLPVDWSLGSVGYDAVKKALGGQLKLRAEAIIGVSIGEWEERIWYRGQGIGAKVRL